MMDQFPLITLGKKKHLHIVVLMNSASSILSHTIIDQVVIYVNLLNQKKKREKWKTKKLKRNNISYESCTFHHMFAEEPWRRLIAIMGEAYINKKG